MKLYIMKQECLELLKRNLPNVYAYYYTEKTNQWIKDLFGGDPFVQFGNEIPDFSLEAIDGEKMLGEIDLENCKILYSNLKFLTESQASDERIWAGLTHTAFYDYMRKRGKYDTKAPLEKTKGANEIRSRFFFTGGTRAGFFRNMLAKYWWVGRALYNPDSTNHFEKLDILGASDMSTKISDIFYSYTFSSNQQILDGIIGMYKYFNEEGIKLPTMTTVRPALQHLNSVGGGLILDCLSSEEITQELVHYIEGLLQGDSTEAHYQNEQFDDD